LTLAAVNPAAVQTIVTRIIPKTLLEYGCDSGDPTWAFFGPSWSDDPDVWEEARAELADIIESGTSNGPAKPAGVKILRIN
jgi:hypothetical protein